MTELLTQNSKMAKSSKDTGWLIVNFGIPAYRSADGTITCPLAGACGELGGCYALQGSYTWSPVKAAYEYRLSVTRQDNFKEVMINEVNKWRKKAEKKDLKLAVRVHDSGDYYSAEYYLAWQQIAKACPDVKFYSYTKMVPLVKRLGTTDNFVMTLS